ncbi:Protein NEDD1 [Bagarius yarrelli]|uniref:glutaminase n=1 Tax=Bagarius yarrelli TaxID=175774 RepID=A0A556TNJ3_BAGYA|nr:Protein NEDD1 [Bagarius yarrelli]
MEDILNQEADENSYLCFQRTPSFRRKWRKRYGGLDGSKLLKPNKEEDMRENGVLTDGLSERNAAPVKKAEAQVPVYKLCPATATLTLTYNGISITKNISIPVPRKAIPTERPVDFVTPGSTVLPTLINNGSTKLPQNQAETERVLTAQLWPSISRTGAQQSQPKRKVAADVLFDSFASGGKVSTNHFFETLWCSGIIKTDPRVKDCYSQMKKLQDADGAVDRNTFQRLSLGDWNEPCVLGEIAWALIYALGVNQLGIDCVHRYVGLEEYAKYKSPFTLSEQDLRKDIVRLHALSFYLQEKKCFPEAVDINATLELLLQCLSTEVTCESGAALAATLANGGLCPMSDDQVLSTSAVRSTLSIMQVAGMNNYSRIFHFKTSMPAKSSSSGIVLIVVPGVLGITCWSPELDTHGNSWKAVHFCEELVSAFQLHSFDIRTPFTQVLSYRQWKVESEGYQIMNILLAAYRGDLHSLRRYFLSGADLNAVDYDGRSALHVAASEGRLEVLKFLMESTEANCTLKDRWGNTALQEALLKEKISGVEGTKLDEDFIKMEKKTKTTNKLIVELTTKTNEYLQPNPAYRARLSLHKKMPWIRENANPVGYPQTEGILGECMVIYGAKLGVESVFGSALVDTGKALKQVAKVRDCMDARVRCSFIEPLQILHQKELKEIAYHLKKLEGRRLDLDYKKRSRKITEAELQQAFDKFEESKELSKRSMVNLLENESLPTKATMEEVTRLVSSGDCLKIWDSTSMSVVEQFNPHSASHPLAQVCWSSSNQYIVSASSIGDKLVVTSLKSSPVPVMELAEGKKQTRVALNSTSQFLVSGGLDNTVNIWDLKTKRLHRNLKDHKEEVTCVSFNGGDSYIASGSTSGDIILHSITTNLSSKPFGHGPNEPVHDLKYSLIKRSLLGSVSDSGSVVLWDANTQKELHMFEGAHKAPASGLAFSPANDLLFITVGLDKKIVCYDTSSKVIFRSKLVESPLTAVDFTPDGAGLVVGSTQGRLYTYDLRNLSSPVKTITAHKTSVTCIRFQHSNTRLKTSKTVSGKTSSSQSNKRISVKLGQNQQGVPSTPTSSVSTFPEQQPVSGGQGQSQSIGNVNFLCASVRLVSGGSSEVPSREVEGQQSLDKFNTVGRNSLNLDIFSPVTDGGNADVFLREAEGQHSTDKVRVCRNSLDIFSPVRDDYKGHRLSDASSGKKDLDFFSQHGSAQRKNPLGTTGARCYSPLSAVQTPPPIKEEEPVITSPTHTNTQNNTVEKNTYSRQNVLTSPPASQTTHIQSVASFNTPEPSQRTEVPTQLTYDSPVSSSQPIAESAAAGGVSSGAPLTSVQMNFVRNMIHEALEDFRDTCHRDIINLQVEMVRQFYIQLNEIHGLIERYSVNESLVEEIEKLREENKRLRANY